MGAKGSIIVDGFIPLFQAAGSPASRNALLQPGDHILEIDGLDMHKASSDDVAALLRVTLIPVLLASLF